MESQGKQHEIEKYERVSSVLFHSLKSRGCTRALSPMVETRRCEKSPRFRPFSPVFAHVNREPVAKPELILHSCRQISSMETIFHFFGVTKFLIDYI